MLPNLYRRWASARLGQLGPWIQGWQLRSMFAGGPGAGADDAWYTAALQLESWQAQNIPAVGGSIDIYKCFDQLIRLLVYIVLTRTGFPPRVLTAYVNLQENADIYFSFSGHLGMPHEH